MPRRHTERWALAAALVILPSCGTIGPLDGPRDQLDQARALWDDFEPAQYSYSVRRLCFCAPESIGPVRVLVTDGVVVDARYVASNDTVPTSYQSLFPPVEGLFDILEDAYDNEASDVDVTYDVQTGVPTEFFIDFIENAADDELGYEVTVGVEVTTGN